VVFIASIRYTYPAMATIYAECCGSPFDV
jgi:hypothetical protein